MWNPELGDWALRWLHMVFRRYHGRRILCRADRQKQPRRLQSGKDVLPGGLVITSLAGSVISCRWPTISNRSCTHPASGALTLGVLLSLGSLHMFFTKKFVPAGAMLFVSIFCMVMTRHYVRSAQAGRPIRSMRLSPYNPQWGAFGIFLVCFVAP